MSSYQSFVISLKRAYERREHIKEQFAAKNVAFSFFDAIEPSTLKQSEIQLGISLDNSNLSENEKSCFMSHISVWDKAIKDDLEYVAIFEDDIYLSESAGLLLNEVDWINVDFLKIEKTTKHVLLKNKTSHSFKSEKFTLGILKCAHMGAGGYILSKKALIDLMQFIKKQETKDHIDQMIFDWYRKERNLDIYQINPVICIQDCILFPNSQKFQTTLQWRENINKPKIKTFTKLQIEILRLFNQIKDFPLKTKLVFKK